MRAEATLEGLIRDDGGRPLARARLSVFPAGAIGPALQSVGITQGYYFFNAAPYILTLLIMIGSSGSKRAMRDAPGELTITK